MITLVLGQLARPTLPIAARFAAMIAVMAIPLIDLVGTAAAGVFTLCFLVVAGVMVLQRQGFRPADAFPLVVPFTFILISPASEDPLLSLRFAVILAITLVMPALIRVHISRREFMALTATVLLVTFPLNFVFDRGWGGSMQGMFDSKNFFALRAAMTVMFGLWVVVSGGMPFLARAGALVVTALAVVGLIRANSAGAIITGAAASMAFLGIMLSSRLTPLYRSLVYVYMLVFVAVVGALVYANAESVVEAVLTAFSKDAGLTGRDYLWLRAFQYIREHPAFGSGYAAFWVQGNVEAEGLWRALYIASRSGFHFHNLYINNTVETGFVGVTVTCFFLACVLVRVVVNSLRHPDDFAAVSLGLMAMFVMRSYVEVDFPIGFNYFSFLIGILWVFGRRDAEEDRVAAADGEGRPAADAAPVPRGRQYPRRND